MRLLVTIAGTAGALALAGCGGDGDAATAPSLVDASVVVEVQARDNRFAPDALEVAAGTTVRFENVGRNEHNVVAADGTPEAIEVEVADLLPGASAERRLTEPGTYEYFCSLHGTASAGMVATIMVTG